MVDSRAIKFSGYGFYTPGVNREQADMVRRHVQTELTMMGQRDDVLQFETLSGKDKDGTPLEETIFYADTTSAANEFLTNLYTWYPGMSDEFPIMLEAKSKQDALDLYAVFAALSSYFGGLFPPEHRTMSDAISEFGSQMREIMEAFSPQFDKPQSKPDQSGRT